MQGLCLLIHNQFLAYHILIIIMVHSIMDLCLLIQHVTHNTASTIIFMYMCMYIIHAHVICKCKLCMHMCTHRCTCTHLCTYTRAEVFTRAPTHTHTHTHMHTHTHTHAHTHTHTHTHTFSCSYYNSNN